MQRAARRWRAVRIAGLTPRIWKRRLVLMGGGIVVGLAAIAFARLADLGGAAFGVLTAAAPWAPLVVTPIVFALLSVATRRWFHGAQGSGIPQVIAARAMTDESARARLLGLRLTLAKIVMTVIGLAAGAAIGREGPTVQVGASVMFATGSLVGIGRHRGLVLAGAAAGIAAAFNTPLAGILFAVEELAKSYERRLTAITTAIVVIAGVTSLAVIGDYSYFGTVSLRLGHLSDWTAVPVCALAGGIAGGLFSRLLVGGMALARRRLRSLWAGALLAGACGLGVAVLAIATDNYAAGTSYEQTRQVLEAGAILPVWYAPAKFVATLLSSLSGIPGGLFSPSLSVGAGLGSGLSLVLPFADRATVATLAMVGYFAGAVQSPLTAFVIVMEMTTTERATIPLIATSLLAAGISRLIAREPLYHALSHAWLPTHHAPAPAGTPQPSGCGPS